MNAPRRLRNCGSCVAGLRAAEIWRDREEDPGRRRSSRPNDLLPTWFLGRRSDVTCPALVNYEGASPDAYRQSCRMFFQSPEHGWVVRRCPFHARLRFVPGTNDPNRWCKQGLPKSRCLLEQLRVHVLLRPTGDQRTAYTALAPSTAGIDVRTGLLKPLAGELAGQEDQHGIAHRIAR
jgi:hypothetical protein